MNTTQIKDGVILFAIAAVGVAGFFLARKAIDVVSHPLDNIGAAAKSVGNAIVDTANNKDLNPLHPDNGIIPPIGVMLYDLFHPNEGANLTKGITITRPPAAPVAYQEPQYDALGNPF